MKYQFVKHPSRLSSVKVTFGAGSRAEFGSGYPAGIAHLSEHMCFKGSKTCTAKDLLRRVSYYGGFWNAFTSEDLVCYYMTIPEDNIEYAFKYLAEVTTGPIFPEEELKKEKEVVIQEINGYNDDLGQLVYKDLAAKIYKNSLASPIVGTVESVSATTRDDLVRFNKDYYNSRQMHIVLAASSDYRHFVEKYFGIPDDVLLYREPDKTVEYASSFKSIVKKDGAIQNHVTMGFGNEEIRKTLALPGNRAAAMMFTEIFGSGQTSRLWMKVREDLGLVYGIGASPEIAFDGSLFLISTSTEPENLNKVMDAVDGEISSFKTCPPNKEEMECALNQLKSKLYAKVEMASGVAGQAISEEFYKMQPIPKLLSDLESITVDDVMKFSEIIFSGNKYVVIGEST